MNQGRMDSTRRSAMDFFLLDLGVGGEAGVVAG